MTLDECCDTARRVAHGMPPSDFGSTRAINAFGQTLRAEILRERQRCADVVKKLAGADAVYPRGIEMLIDAISNPSD